MSKSNATYMNSKYGYKNEILFECTCTFLPSGKDKILRIFGFGAIAADMALNV